jgi:hypothetical protein
MVEIIKAKMADVMAPQTGLALTVVHLSLIFVMFGVGTILLLPGETFLTGRGYHYFAELSSETNWAILCMLVTAIGLWGFFSSNKHIKNFALLVLSTAHGTAALFIATANPLGVGSVLFATFAGQGYYLAHRRIM